MQKLFLPNLMGKEINMSDNNCVMFYDENGNEITEFEKVSCVDSEMNIEYTISNFEDMERII